MKLKLRWCVVGATLVLGAALAIAAPGTSAATAAATSAPAAVPDFVGELPKGAVIRLRADSLEGLTLQVKPDLQLKVPDQPTLGADFLWFETDAENHPVFRLEHAFLWQPAAPRKPEWLLLAPPAGNRPGIDELPRELIDVHIPIMPKKVESDHFDNYASPIATDAAAGTLYEIGWTTINDRGSGHCNAQRILYVWQYDGKLHFVGEAGTTGSSHSGNEGIWKGVESSARFVGSPRKPVIHALFFENSAETECGDGVGMALLVNRTDVTLEPAVDGSPGKPKVTAHSLYTEALENDTILLIAERLAKRDLSSPLAEKNPEWSFHNAERPLTPAQLDKNAALLRDTTAIIMKLNKDLNEGPPKAGQKVFIPDG